MALDTKDQEDEHSCFSDNTTVDIVGNATGIRMAYTADYPGIDGTSLSDVVAKVEPGARRGPAGASSTPPWPRPPRCTAPFDQLILGDDDAPAGWRCWRS